MIFTNYWYKNKLLGNRTFYCRDNMFFPGKYFEVFELWWWYIQKHHPNEHIYIIDMCSPIPIEEVLYLFPTYEFVEEDSFEIDSTKKVHIKRVKKEYDYENGAFVPHYYALKFALLNHCDLYWIDRDCLINENFFNVVSDECWYFCNTICFDNMIVDLFFYFIKINRLEESRSFFNLVDIIDNVFNSEREKVLQYAFLEGNYFNQFCYGDVVAVNSKKLTHLSSYNRLVEFLEDNPLDIPAYHRFLNLLKNIKIDSNLLLDFNCA